MTLPLPESGVKSSRLVEISVARVPAVSSKKKNDPIVILAGGPGMGAQLMYTIAPSAFSRVRRDRDILLIDQRGTGNSTPLHCAGAAEDPFAAGQDSLDIQPFISMTAACRNTLSKNHDLRAFTTSRAVRDLDEIRSRLGYDALNLYGVSYGSRVAQHYARVFPTRVRSMVLDGVAAPQT
ncbi:MAG: alpha/beta fold hydrolase, partial [Steroidobacteraceae bacterium]